MEHRPNQTSIAFIIFMGLINPSCGGSEVYEPQGPAQAQDPALSATAANIGGCAIFPADNAWNRDVSADPVDPNSAAYISAMNGGTKFLHPDFGGGGAYGLPWISVPSTQALSPMRFTWADESDPGPYPFPASAPIESGGDAHVIVLQRGTCQLYETFNSVYRGSYWQADSGARFNLKSNALRPEGWTSADAAGLPILPGLVRRDEVLAGQITHALRFTAARTQRAHVHPATHSASSATATNLPPMGLRVRLKASFDVSGYTGAARVILTALKRYGMLLADNGSDWFITGERNTGWSDSDLGQLKRVPGSAFEVVKLGAIYKP